MTQRRAKSARIAGKEEFKPGDLVKLKNGGPALVVSSYHKQTDRYRVWWAVNDHIMNANLPAAALKRMKAPL